MHKLHFIWLLCIIVTVFTMLSCYRIETYINLEQKTTAEDIPQTINDMSCYNYLKATTNWKIDSYSPNIKKMLSAFKTGFKTRSSDISTITPYADVCVIPYEHKSMFAINDDCSVVNSPYTKHVLKHSDGLMDPKGCYVDFGSDYANESKFKDLLGNMDNNFNIQYINRINELKNLVSEKRKETMNAQEQERSLDSKISTKEQERNVKRTEYNALESAIKNAIENKQYLSDMTAKYNKLIDDMKANLPEINDRLDYFTKLIIKYSKYI